MWLLRNVNDWFVFSESYGDGSFVIGPERYPCLALTFNEDGFFFAGEEPVFIYTEDVASLMEGLLEAVDSPTLLNEIEDMFPLIKEALTSGKGTFTDNRYLSDKISN